MTHFRLQLVFLLLASLCLSACKEEKIAAPSQEVLSNNHERMKRSAAEFADAARDELSLATKESAKFLDKTLDKTKASTMATLDQAKVKSHSVFDKAQALLDSAGETAKEACDDVSKAME